jgi:peptidoglycan L-alanyl-D-glutamate endopeptidase CwlK
MPAVNRSLDALYPAFREKVEEIQAEMNRWCEKHRPGGKCIVTETFRTTARQVELYAQGRTAPGPKVTNKNGTSNRSNHQSGLAVDFALFRNGTLDWNDEAFWQYLGHCVRAKGLTWGGDWKDPVDKPHAEWKTSDKATYTAARKWLKQNGLV